MRIIPDPPAPFATLYGETVLLPPPPPPPPVFASQVDRWEFEVDQFHLFLHHLHQVQDHMRKWVLDHIHLHHQQRTMLQLVLGCRKMLRDLNVEGSDFLFHLYHLLLVDPCLHYRISSTTSATSSISTTIRSIATITTIFGSTWIR